MKRFQSMTIVGVGLLGGSLAKACRKLGIVETIAGCGRNRDNLENAKTRGVIDSWDTDIKKAVTGSDLIVLCCPVGAIATRVREMLPALKPGAIITDVGSVKGPLVRDIESLIPDSISFIGSHPIAGGDQAGLAAARANLFEGAQCIVTPTAQSDPQAYESVINFWERLDMKVLAMDAQEHDFILSAVSHLPHVVSFALMNTLGKMKTKDDRIITNFSGEGLKDSTRIASGDPVMWRDICLSNQDSLLKMIDRFQATLQDLRASIENGQGECLEKKFSDANGYRKHMLNNGR